MWTSVPQIPVLRTRIRTSLIPMVGSGMSSSQRPRSALLLTSAFMGTLRPQTDSLEVYRSRQWGKAGAILPNLQLEQWLDVQVLDVEGVVFDEFAALFNVFTHERGKDFVGFDARTFSRCRAAIWAVSAN